MVVTGQPPKPGPIAETGGRVRCADPRRARRPRSQEGVTFATPLSAPSLRSLLGIAVVPC
ncbi:MAG: hypothetical protein [Olavius algarvensis Gamma 1 endosymbiont]|nr:MAG: hypothetical protein [Olavius algarvensis Gamma 1 endosymbiont]